MSEITTAEEYWTCASCLKEVPFGFAHLCSAKSSNDQTPAIFPGQLSMVELNKKLDKIQEDVKLIKEKTDKIKE